MIRGFRFKPYRVGKFSRSLPRLTVQVNVRLFDLLGTALFIALPNSPARTDAKATNSITAFQVILSHTPFKSLLPRLAQTPVLLSGRHDIQTVASSYGFNRTITVDQLASAYPRAVPNYPPLQCKLSCLSHQNQNRAVAKHGANPCSPLNQYSRG